MRVKEIYFNFPIHLLEGFIIKPSNVLNNIMDYAIYSHSQNPSLHGSENKRIKDSADHFGITLGNVVSTNNNGKRLFNNTPKKSPMAGIGKEMLFEFYKNEKTEFEKVSLLGFLAIKSILGNKDYCNTNNSLWLARMDGKPKAIKETLTGKNLKYSNQYNISLSVEINKYANEYQCKKIKNELRTNWGLITYSRYCKGFFISYNLVLKALIKIAETSRKSNKEKEYKQLEKEILKEVLNELKTPP